MTNLTTPTLAEMIDRVRKEITRTENLPEPESKLIAFARKRRLAELHEIIAGYSQQQEAK
jgi:hypothetical protein